MNDETYYGKRSLESETEKGPSQFDRTFGALHGLPDVTQTKPTTLRVVPPFGIRSELYVVQTIRQAEVGDTIFLEFMSEETKLRLVIPPKVANAIARQRDQLTTKVRSKVAKQTAKDRMDRGELPGFMLVRNKGKEKKEA